MEIIYHIAFGIHLLAVVGILVLLSLQANKNPKKLNAGVVHAALTAFVAALVMVGLWDQVNAEPVAGDPAHRGDAAGDPFFARLRSCGCCRSSGVQLLQRSGILRVPPDDSVMRPLA